MILKILILQIQHIGPYVIGGWIKLDLKKLIKIQKVVK